LALQKAHASGNYNPTDIKAIGIAYQMHGLVVVNKEQEVLRDSIIWCDSRAVEFGDLAYQALGTDTCSSCLLNAPGNFTASKLAWVKNNEPALFEQVAQMMLPGDFIAMKLTGTITTTPSALSEGILWNFKTDALSAEVMENYGFKDDLIPEVRSLFSVHGEVLESVARELGLMPGIPVSYKAGDQLNNAVSLNVFQPGEVAATAGTSGVIYAVTDQLFSDPHSRVNAFAHVNHSKDSRRLGVLLCINGTGIMNSWLRNLMGRTLSYPEMNEKAATIAPGSNGLAVLPFGNGVERMLRNKLTGAQLLNIDLNIHTPAHVIRATQEGIAFAFRYGLDIMRENGLHPKVIRAGKANMFLSDVFTESFVNTTGVPVQLFSNDGSVGAALGAGIGAGIYTSFAEAFTNLKVLKTVEPTNTEVYEGYYQEWKKNLENKLANL
jgi:xylulokinase